MVSKEEFESAIKNNPAYAADEVNIEIETIVINDVPRCVVYGEDGSLIFDDTEQMLERYNDEDELVATKSVNDIDSAVKDVIEFGNWGEMEGETKKA
jgi:hypothetical protein